MRCAKYNVEKHLFEKILYLFFIGYLFRPLQLGIENLFFKTLELFEATL